MNNCSKARVDVLAHWAMMDILCVSAGNSQIINFGPRVIDILQKGMYKQRHAMKIFKTIEAQRDHDYTMKP